jgi:2-keto-4-pentenoate hydratase/2-oxohepta-3-ene-1,7-dioic acid hydratase in catechol pathway
MMNSIADIRNLLPELPGLPGLFVRNIYAIGRNYAAHAKELNNPVPDHPVIFTKPLASLAFDGIIRIPSFVREPHFETELVAAIGKTGKNIERDNALDHIAGYGLGIDVTARDIQQQLKDASHPWFLAKGLDTFAPVSSFLPAETLPEPEKLTFTLDVNGKRRQFGDPSLMLFPVPDLIARLSCYVTLRPGDLIFTGTPEGVGLLRENDFLHAELLSGRIVLDVRVEQAS